MKDKSKLEIFTLLNTLTDSMVIIPCTADVSDKDKEALEEFIKGGDIKFTESPNFHPDYIINSDNTKYIPIYSKEELIDSKYKKDYILLHVYMTEFMPLYDTVIDNAEGFILDNQIYINIEFINIMKDMVENKLNGTFNKDEYYKQLLEEK